MMPLFLAFGIYLLISVIVLQLQTSLLEQRFSGPRDRLIRSLERVRGGDVSFRVEVRRTDQLRELALELNRVLEWLNQNPPVGVRTGSDLVDVDVVADPIWASSDELDQIAPALMTVDRDADLREVSR